MAVIGEHGAVVSEITVEASPETVFEFFTEADKLQRWMGIDAAVDGRPGGTWRVDFNGRGSAAAGEVVELDPPRRIVFTWGWEQGAGAPFPLPPGASTVEVTLAREGERTRVRLEHRDLPPELRVFHRLGWGHSLPRLSVAAAGGDPGPDPLASIRDLGELSALVGE